MGDLTKVTVSDLSPGETFYFVVTAYNDLGLESLPSTETSFLATEPLSVALVSPLDGTQFVAPATVNLRASATGGSLAQVIFYNGEVPLGADSTSPLEFTWNGIPAGTYTITARAMDATGAMVMSAPIQFSVTGQVATLGGIVRLPDGSIEFPISGNPNQVHHIWVSNDVKNWSLLKTVTNASNGTVIVNDAGAIGADRRFYKVTTD